MNLNTDKGKVVVLLSGGIDSSALIPYYIENNFSPQALFIDYGQPALKPELDAATAISLHYSIELIKVSITGIKWNIQNNDEIIGRNLLLASLAIGNFPDENGLVSMGIHSGTGYFDCSVEFIEKLNEIAEIVSGGLISCDFPFASWHKTEIMEFCINSSIPLDKTYSCIKGTTPPCGKCLSCLDRINFEVDRKNSC